jgi:hypothetical protein
MTSFTIPQELIDQQTNLTNQISEIEKNLSELTAQKSEVETQLHRVENAIRYLKGEAIPILKTTGVRRPMSAESKERIRQGLLKANAAKKAAKSSEAAPIPVPATPASPAPKATGRAKRA